MEQGLAASMMYGNGKGNTITSAYGGVLPPINPIKKPDKVKEEDKNEVVDVSALVKKPEYKSYSGIRG